ncbi:MAG: hypothetical protein JNJ58_05795 [Chitinophagaceae bacterium]|nr:hypothetical protein [Chitinophagaceae bacterium]
MNKLHFHLILFLAVLLVHTQTFAQAPNQYNYQGVALNGSGTPISNSTINLKFRIFQGVTNAYKEERAVLTDNMGHFSCVIGSPGAVNITGSLNNIDWSNYPNSLQVSMDASGGTNFTVLGLDTFKTVPYAQYANRATKADSLMLPFEDTDNNTASFKVTNTLSGGTAIWGKATNINPNSAGIMGEGNGGSSVGVKATNTTGFAVYATGTPTSLNPVIYGQSTGSAGSGVKGKSDGAAGVGVYGESLAGKGVEGYGNNAGSIGVKGSALAGIGVKAYSFSGTALDVEGNLKIAGGNTTPGLGKVLTSDASGNATWKSPGKVGFVAENNNTITVNHNTTITMTLQGELYDNTNSLNLSGSAIDPNTFVAPVSGFYHFTARCFYLYQSLTYNLEGANIWFRVNTTDLKGIGASAPLHISTQTKMPLELNRDIHLNAGDKVVVRTNQINGGGGSAVLWEAYFSGYLIYED